MQRRDRARAVGRGRPLVSGDLATVSWLTGLTTDIEVGPSPFSAPPVVVVDPDGGTLVIASEDEAGGLLAGVEARTFPGFAVEEIDRPREAARLAVEALGGAGALAVDLHSLPGSVAAELARRGVQLDDVGAELRAARAVKDPDEIQSLRASTRVADAGQAAARSAFRAGKSELEVWGEVRAAMEREAGARTPILADFVTGGRTAEIGGPPGERLVEDDDLLLVDLVPRVGGYWADSCATVALGGSASDVRRAHEACRAALDLGVSLLRPGTATGEVDERVRGAVGEAGGSYPHHTGHGVGVAFHEAPRVVPGGRPVLEPGMVVALEPGWYGDGWGVRVECLALVTEAEPEVLSGHDLSL